jgi:hypothetical protein
MLSVHDNRNESSLQNHRSGKNEGSFSVKIGKLCRSQISPTVQYMSRDHYDDGKADTNAVDHGGRPQESWPLFYTSGHAPDDQKMTTDDSGENRKDPKPNHPESKLGEVSVKRLGEVGHILEVEVSIERNPSARGKRQHSDQKGKGNARRHLKI